MRNIGSKDKQIKNNIFKNIFSFKSKDNSSDKGNYKYMPLQITFLYALFGCLWIIFSDKIVFSLADNSSTITRLQTFKGWFFVAATSYMIFVFINKGTKKTESFIEKVMKNEANLKRVNEELIKTKEQLSKNFSQLKKKEETIRLNEEKYKAIVECSDSDIWEIDMECGNTSIPGELFKITEQRAFGRYKYNLIVNDSIHPDDKYKVTQDFENHIQGRTIFFQSEFRLDNRNDNNKWVLCRAKALRDVNGRITRVVGSLGDITDRKQFESKLVTMAFYDPLTDLPNRTLFSNKLDTALKNMRGDSEQGCVLFIDIDDFKKVNDTLGHNYGDQLIKLIAEMLKISVERDDIICRFGGDEFVILHPGTGNSTHYSSMAARILNIFNNPFEIGEKQIFVTASIGITVYPNDGKDESTLLKNADAAMYKAKEQGKNMYYFYDKEIYSEINRKSIVEKYVRNALKNYEFTMYYQPQIDARTGKIDSFEALVRWKSPEFGIVMPSDFISVAEETGLIIPMGEWILRSVCAQNKEWKQKGYSYDFIAINISPVQLRQNGFVEMIERVLKETGLSPDNIEIEITENILVKPFNESIEVLFKLYNMGVRIALDDFGTGYSSLNYLRLLPINTLKIDKSFINSLDYSSSEMSIVEGIVTLAHKMNLTVIAEGVEKEEQIKLLKESNCDKFQGFYFSKAVSAEDIENLFRTNMTAFKC